MKSFKKDNSLSHIHKIAAKKLHIMKNNYTGKNMNPCEKVKSTSSPHMKSMINGFLSQLQASIEKKEGRREKRNVRLFNYLKKSQDIVEGLGRYEEKILF